MSQNSGPFLVSSHGHPGFNPRAPSSSSSKRISNGLMTSSSPGNPPIGPNMALSSSPSPMRPVGSMVPMKPGSMGMNPMDKSNSMTYSYSNRYSRKPWPVTRSMNDKGIRGHDDHEAPYLRPGIPGHVGPMDSMNNSSFTIEPSTDDDEADDIYFSSRHIAAARFQRNQRLLCEIFNEVCIPDLRSNVNVDRISTLRRQVEALKTHRETFEKDLNELEEKHSDKKRKFLEANEKFHNEYAEASSTNLSREKINEILQKYEAMEKLQKEKQLLLQQQQQQAAATPPPPPPPPPVSTSVVPQQPTVAPLTKTEHVPTVEVPQQQIAPQPPIQPPVPTQLPPSQPMPTQLPPQPLQTQVPSQPIQTPLPPQSLQTQVPPQPVPVQIPPVPSSQHVPTSLPPTQHIPTPLPPIQHVQTSLPPIQTVQSPMAPTQPIQSQLAPPPQPVMQQMPPQQQVPLSQPIMQQMPPQQQIPPPQPVMQQMPMQQQVPPQQPVMQQMPPQQQVPPPQQQPPQGYPMMHQGGGYAPAPGYGHPQQTQQYRPPMNQRQAQYPPNVQWQQQQPPPPPPQQQQWQPNAYDPRYYNPYPPNVQWPQQQQWGPNQPPPQQQQMGMVPQQQPMGVVPQQQQGPPPQMRGPPQQQPPPPQMYVNGVNYGYGGGPGGWNSGPPPPPHPSQQYGYPQNPPYDPSGMSGPPQQQYYAPPPQGYDYGPPPPQQQQQAPLPPQQQQPPPQMN